MENEVCCQGKGARVWLAVLAILCLTGIVVVAILRDRIVNQNQYQVSVEGQGKVAYQPDIAQVNLGVQVDRVDKAENALNQLSGKMKKVVVAIKAAGIPAEDIQTQNYSLYPQYEVVNNISTVVGYSANQQVLVKVRRINENENLVPNVISAATKAGTNQVNGIYFESSKLNDLKQQARLKAIEDARSKAGSLAQATGVKLGKVVGWWENYVSPDMAYMDGKGGASGVMSSGPIVPSGNQELILTVSINYQVK